MLISPGDLVDAYFRLRQNRRMGNVLRRLFGGGRARTAAWWNRTESPPSNWWDVPLVGTRINSRISGKPEVSYGAYFGERYFGKRRTIRILSIGCGTGSKEIGLARLWPEWKVTGFDASAERIHAARKEAARLSLANVEFLVDDIYRFDFGGRNFDVVVFDSSLHHFSAFDRLFDKISAALPDDGLLVIHEYTGPDRFQWTAAQLDTANRLLGELPHYFRTRWGTTSVKGRIYRPGILRMKLTDPSEAIYSSRILPALHRHFRTIEEKPLGGNLLHLVLKDIAHHFTGENKHAVEQLYRLFEAEDRFCAENPSDFMFGIYSRQKSG